MLKFKPPNSILKTIQEKQNTNIINYETTKAANEMYNKDPVVKHNIENFTNTRTNGLLPKEKINEAMKEASNESFGYTEEPLVSTDIIGTTYSMLDDSSYRWEGQLYSKLKRVYSVFNYQKNISFRQLQEQN